MRSMRAVVVGSYVQDHIWRTAKLPSPGESRIGTFSSGAGGKGFNQAVALARQLSNPADVHFIGALGNDLLAPLAKLAASKFGLHCTWFEKSASTAAASVIVDGGGANLICVALGANAQLGANEISKLLQNSLHADSFPGVVLVQLEIALPATKAALEFARKNAVRSILNPAPINADVSAELLALADILTPNETELIFLLNHLYRYEFSASDFHDDEALHRAARVLSQGTVVVTMGAAGVFVSHGADRMGDLAPYYRCAAHAVAVVDTTGAGDAFSGGLAAASLLFSETPFSEWVAHAMKVAALSIQANGAADSMPSFDEVLTKLGGAQC